MNFNIIIGIIFWKKGEGIIVKVFGLCKIFWGGKININKNVIKVNKEYLV